MCKTEGEKKGVGGKVRKGVGRKVSAWMMCLVENGRLALKSEYAYQQFKENFTSECDSNITSDIKKKTSAVSQNKIYHHFSFHPPKFSDGS